MTEISNEDYVDGLLIRLMGPVRMEFKGVPIRGRGLRELALLARLALEPGLSVSRDRLIEDVWNGIPPKSGSGALRVQVKRLRKLFEDAGVPGVLETRPNGYGLAIDELNVDVFLGESFTFDALAGIADNSVRAMDLFEQARSMRSGRPMGGLEDLSFAVVASQNIQMAAESADQRFGRVLLENGFSREASDLLGPLVAEDPLDSDLVIAQMQALRKIGIPHESLRLADLHRESLANLGLLVSDQVVAEEQMALGLEKGPVIERDTALIGRESECAELGATLLRLENGVGGITCIAGDSGVGKTALLEWILRQGSERGLRSSKGSADRFETDVPLHALRSVVGALPSTTDAVDAATSELIAELAKPASDIVVIGGVESSWYRHATRRNIMEALQSDLSTQTVLILDDLQWADESSLAVLRSVAEATSHLPLLLVLAGQKQGAWRQRIHAEQASTVMLEPLTKVDSQKLAKQLVSGDLDPSLRSAVDRSDGLPIFIVELIRGFQSEGRLVDSNGHISLVGDAIPASIEEAIRVRLEQVPNPVRELCELVCVLGPESKIDALASLLTKTPLQVARLVGEASELGILQSVGMRVEFCHGLVREAVERTMPASIKAELHRQAASLLADLGMPVTSVAAHAALANTTENDVVLQEWLREAASSTAVLDPDTALRYLDRALDLQGGNPRSRYELQRAKVEALVSAGKTEEASRLLESLVQLVPERAADASLRLAGLRLVENRAMEARAEAEQMLSTTAPDGPASRPDLRQQSRLHAASSLASLFLLDKPSAHRSATRAIQLSNEVGDLLARSVGTAILGRLASFGLNRQEALRYGQLSVQLAQSDETGQPHGYLPWSFFAMSALDFDEHEIAKDALSKGMSTSRRLNMPWSESINDGLAMSLDFRLGNTEAVVLRANEVIERRAEVGPGSADAWAHSFLALLALRAGEMGTAVKSVADARLAASEVSSPLGGDFVALAASYVQSCNGDFEGALGQLRDTWDFCQAVGVRGILPVVAPGLMRLAMKLGDQDLVLEVRDVCEQISQSTGVPAYQALAIRMHGLAEGDAAKMASACALYQETERQLDQADCDAESAYVDAGEAVPPVLVGVAG